ncbi:glycoside hydrolase [Entophlyctis helioformis]|nr:glycoside hydrolase [Entophlyctis helioformis]
MVTMVKMTRPPRRSLRRMVLAGACALVLVVMVALVRSGLDGFDPARGPRVTDRRLAAAFSDARDPRTSIDFSVTSLKEFRTMLNYKQQKDGARARLGGHEIVESSDSRQTRTGFPPFLEGDRGYVDKPKQAKVKEMMKHAWDGYMTYAKGADELQPLSQTPFNWYGSVSLLSTPVDALDTLYIMGLDAEYNDAKNLVLSQLRLDSSFGVRVSVFETNIRVLGGLLGAYEVDGDMALLRMAVRVGDVLMGAFDTPSGLPVNWIDLHTGVASDNEGMQRSSCLAEIGTLQLEFQYLSDVTGDSKYSDAALYALEQLYKMDRPVRGLYPLYVNIHERKFKAAYEYSLAGESDSFYEYLLKLFISTGEKRYLDRFHEAGQAIDQYLVKRSEDGTRAFLSHVYADLRPGANTFHHLSCFAGGMFALGGAVDPSSPRSDKWKQLGASITESCYGSYASSNSGLGGEQVDGTSLRPLTESYYLRPEVVESLFYMWRLTHDIKYRTWGWSIVEALESRCRGAAGFHGLSGTSAANGGGHDRQESFFLAETLKYLFLLFSDDDTVPIEGYVFNTEAHVLSIRGYGRRTDASQWVPVLGVNASQPAGRTASASASRPRRSTSKRP